MKKLNTLVKWISDRDDIIKMYEDKKMYKESLKERDKNYLLEDVRALVKIHFNEYKTLSDRDFTFKIMNCFGIVYDKKLEKYKLKDGGIK